MAYLCSSGVIVVVDDVVSGDVVVDDVVSGDVVVKVVEVDSVVVVIVVVVVVGKDGAEKWEVWGPHAEQPPIFSPDIYQTLAKPQFRLGDKQTNKKRNKEYVGLKIFLDL